MRLQANRQLSYRRLLALHRVKQEGRPFATVNCPECEAVLQAVDKEALGRRILLHIKRKHNVAWDEIKENQLWFLRGIGL